MISDQAVDKLEPDPFQVEPDPVQVVGLTIKEAAAELGISEKTVRHRIKLNQLPALKIETPQGYQWRVYPDGLPPGVQVEPDPLPPEREVEEELVPAPVQMETPALLEVLHMLDTRQAMIDHLQQEALEKAEKIAELTGTAAHWQARAVVAEEQARRAEEQVQRLLMAPKEEPTDVTPQEAPTQADSGPDWQAIAQALEERVKRLEEPPAEPEAARPWWKRLFA